MNQGDDEYEHGNFPPRHSAADHALLRLLGVPDWLHAVTQIVQDPWSDRYSTALWLPDGWIPDSDVVPFDTVREAARVGVPIELVANAPIDLRWFGDAAPGIRRLMCDGPAGSYSGIGAIAGMTNLRMLVAPETQECIDLSGLVHLKEVTVFGAGLLSALRAPRLRRAGVIVGSVPTPPDISLSVELLSVTADQFSASWINDHPRLRQLWLADVNSVDFGGLQGVRPLSDVRVVRSHRLSGVAGLAASGRVGRLDIERVSNIDSLEDLFTLDIGFLHMEGCPQVDARIARAHGSETRILMPFPQRGGVRIVPSDNGYEIVFDQWGWLATQLGGDVDDAPPMTSVELEDVFVTALRLEFGEDFITDRVQPDSEGDAVHLVFTLRVDATRAKKVLDRVLSDAKNTLSGVGRGAAAS